MKTFIHESADGKELEFCLNEQTGVVTMGILEEDSDVKPQPFSTYDGSLPYPALKSGFNSQTVKLVRLEIFLVDILNQYEEGIITTRAYTTNNCEIIFTHTPQYGFKINVKDFNSFNHLWIIDSEIVDVLQTLIKWLDETIGWSNEIEESVL